MTDKALLELAAKAAKIFVTPETWPYRGAPITPEDMETYFDPEDMSITGIRVWFGIKGEIGGTEDYTWNPLCDDADAFQLMVKLNLAVEVCKEKTMAFYDEFDAKTTCMNAFDKADATRRAIVMAAAEIGKGM